MWGWTGTAAAGSSATPAENRRLRPAGYRVLSSERHDRRHFGCRLRRVYQRLSAAHACASLR